MLINTETLKVDMPSRPIVGLDGARDIDGALQPHLLHALLDNLKVDGNHARHLDRAAKADLSIALAKMQIAHAELGPVHMHRQVHLTSPAQVLDIAVATMFRSTGDRPGALFRNLLPHLLTRRAARMRVLRQRQVRHIPILQRASSHQAAFSAIPLVQHLLAGGAPQNARVN